MPQDTVAWSLRFDTSLTNELKLASKEPLIAQEIMNFVAK